MCHTTETDDKTVLTAAHCTLGRRAPVPEGNTDLNPRPNPDYNPTIHPPEHDTAFYTNRNQSAPEPDTTTDPTDDPRLPSPDGTTTNLTPTDCAANERTDIACYKIDGFKPISGTPLLTGPNDQPIITGVVSAYDNDTTIAIALFT